MVKFKNAFILAAAALLVFAGVAGAQTSSGAAGFSIVAAPASVTTGGTVNMTIQVLDANGNINLASNGQAGDVMFTITSSLGTKIYPSNNWPDDYTQGGPDYGRFASASSYNITPGSGLVLAHVHYGSVPGTDQITVRMFQSVMTGGYIAPGNQIGPAQTFTVNVAQGAGISSISSVGLSNPTNSSSSYPQQYQVAGATAAVQVTVPAGQSGDVTVNFVGINKADANGNNASGTTVTADVTVNNGIGTGTATFTKAGYYEIRATADNGNVTFTQTAGSYSAPHVLPKAYAVEILPADPAALTLSTNMSVVSPSSTADVTVTSQDQYGNVAPNPSTATTPIKVTLTPSGTGTVNLTWNSIAPGSSTATGTITGASTGNVSVTASASGLTDSAAVPMTVAATSFTSASIDDGSGAAATSPVVLGVGQTLKVINITATGAAKPLVAGQPVTLGLGSHVLSSTLVATGSSFSATFTLPTSTVSATNAVLQAGNGAVGSISITPTVTVLASAGKTISIVNANGFPITSFDAGNNSSIYVPDGNSAGTTNSPFSGGRFVVQDAYGNDVTFGASGLTGTLTSSNLSGGNNATVDLGSDVATDNTLTWPTSFLGSDTITLTPIASSGIAPITFDVTNVGSAPLSAITVTPAATQTLANSIIPFTVTLTGGASSANLIVSLVSNGTLSQITDRWGNVISTGAMNISSGQVFGLATGNTQGTVTIQVSTADGTIVGQSPVITVATNAGLPVGDAAGAVNVTATADQILRLDVNTTNTAGDTPAQTWFVFTATHNGQNLGLFLLKTDGTIVPVSSLSTPTDFAGAQFDFGTSSPATIGTLTMADLGLSSGDTLTYAYAYSTSDVTGVVIENVVTITVQ